MSRTFLTTAANAVGGLSVLYGVYYAIRLFFFDITVCDGPEMCRWFADGWHPVLVGVLFLAYLPISPIVGALAAWPGYVLSAILLWLAGRRSD